MRLWILTLIMLLVVISPVFATDARVGAVMGASPYIIDEVRVFQNPSLIKFFSNRAVLELGMYRRDALPTNQSGYAFFHITGSIYFGAGVLRKEDEFYLMGMGDGGECHYYIPNPVPPAGLTLPNNEIDLILATDMGGIALGLGVHMARKYWKRETDSNEELKKTSALGIKIGASYVKDDEMLFEGNVRIGMNSYKHETATFVQESDGGISISLDARTYLPMGEATLIPRVAFSTFSYKDMINDNETFNASLMTLTVGAGLKVNALGGWVLPAVEINYRNGEKKEDSVEYTLTALTLPHLVLASEFPATDWLVVRVGVNRFYGTQTQKETTDGEITTTQDVTSCFLQPDMLTLGAGVVLFDGTLTIDGTVGDDLLHKGGYIFSGEKGSIFGRVSLGVNFGK